MFPNYTHSNIVFRIHWLRYNFSIDYYNILLTLQMNTHLREYDIPSNSLLPDILTKYARHNIVVHIRLEYCRLSFVDIILHNIHFHRRNYFQKYSIH